MSRNPERLLPSPILAKAARYGQELGWRREDLPSVLAAAEAQGIAVLGGQVQFLFEDGTCELYWQNYDATGRREGEPWPAFVVRSHEEVRVALSRLPETEELVKDGISHFQFLRAQAERGVDLAQHLWFICDLAPTDPV